MVMGSMGIEQKMFVLSGVRKSACLIIFLGLLVYYPYSHAKGFWTINPSLTFSETFSDNINLAESGREREAFVTELSPGISIRRNTARHALNLDYRMQNLYNSGGNNELDLFHQLRADSNLEIFRNSLFVDVTGSIDQQNVTNFNSANDNSSGGGNSTTVMTYGISPYWTPHLDGYANGEVRFNYNKLMTDNGGASDTENFDYSVRLESGRRFSRVTWLANYNNRQELRDSGDDVKFEDSFFEVRGHFNRHFNVFAQAGHANNVFRSTTGENNNGVFYTIGAKWIPIKRFSLEIGVGNNSFVTLDVTPIRNMHWVTTYRNDDVGTNTDQVWETVFDYRTKRSVWNASYREETTTLQTLLATNQSFTITDDLGNPIIDPVTQQSVQFDTSLPTLVDEVIITRTGEISVSYQSGKSELFARLFSTRTTFQVSERKNDVIGVNGSWNWDMTRRTEFFLRPAWQRTTRETIEDNRFDVAIGLDRRIPIVNGGRGRLNARLEYRYTNQMSDLKTNEFIENRITANLFFTY